MNYSTIGTDYAIGDEQRSSLPGVRFIAPTQFDKAVDKMAQIIKLQYPGKTSKLLSAFGGFFGNGNLETFTEKMILILRQQGVQYTPDQKQKYIELLAAYKYDAETAGLYLDVWEAATAAGYLGDAIKTPWTYNVGASPVGSTVGGTVASMFSGIAGPLLPIIVVSVAVYAYIQRKK